MTDPFAPADIAVVGPMARSAEDLALSLDIVAGPGPIGSPRLATLHPAPRIRPNP